MSVSASIDLEQLDSPESEGTVSDRVMFRTNDGNIRDYLPGLLTDFNFTHLPHITMPAAKGIGYGGWATEDPEDWADSPTNRPELLYRHRFAWGRDRAEAFSTGHTPDLIVTPPDPGQQWGNLDDNSGVVLYERDFPTEGSVHVQDFSVEDSGTITDSLFHTSSTYIMQHLGPVEGEVTLELFPFALQYDPKPFSIKNPVDTDVFLRVSNYAHTIVSGSITMYLNEVVTTDLAITEFFTGLGGFDITWNNAFDFAYDSVVNVRVEFNDSDSPVNKIIIEYPFFIVKDLAAPRVINIVPSDGTENVVPLGTIQFELVDFESGVDISSLVLYVNSIPIQNGEQGVVAFEEREDSLGYVVSYTSFEPLLYGDVIPVAIFVKDNSPTKNEVFYNYSFKVLESTSPRLLNINPLACEGDIPTGAPVSVDVVDGGHGIDKDSVSVSVDDIERSGDVTVIPIVHRDE